MTQAYPNIPPQPQSQTDDAASVEMSGDVPQPNTAPASEQEAYHALLDMLTNAENERDEVKDRLLRTLAEIENVRRRTEKEVADTRVYAVTNFARDMMTVADNIRRALDSMPAEAHNTVDPALKAFIEGIELTERDLLKTFERHGIRPISPQGEKFDPNMHQAMFEAPHPDVADGHVFQVAQIGYSIGDRVLRPALVGVARGGKTPVGSSSSNDPSI